MLEQIVAHKKDEVEKTVRERPLNAVLDSLDDAGPVKQFRLNLSNNGGISIIAEVKRASPIKGLLRPDFDPRELAEAYSRGGASAFSVITEQRFFQGSCAYIATVKQAAALPVLRKDFIFSEYQVFESRALGADAILLIAAILEDETLARLVGLSGVLGMEALVEVHDRRELKRALKAGAGMVGINNRNLKTFRVNLATTLDLAGEIPHGIFLVSESGIATREDILLLEKHGVRSVLVGEALVRSDDPGLKLQELLGISEVRGPGLGLGENMRD